MAVMKKEKPKEETIEDKKPKASKKFDLPPNSYDRPGSEPTDSGIQVEKKSLKLALSHVYKFINRTFVISSSIFFGAFYYLKF